MKPSIGQWSYNFKFIITRIFWALQKLTVVAFACISRHCCSSWAFRGSQEKTPSLNAPEPRGSMTHSLRRAHWDHAHWRGSWFACGRASLPSSPRRGWRARDSGGPARPDVRKRAGCARVGWCQIWRKRSPKPTQRACLACLVAREICVKRRASDAQFGEQQSQRKQMRLAKKVYGVFFYPWGLWDQNDDIMNTLLTAGRAFSMKIR